MSKQNATENDESESRVINDSPTDSNHLLNHKMPKSNGVKSENKFVATFSSAEGLSIQRITLRDVFNVFVLLLNNNMSQWMAYMVVYANPGNTAKTSLEIDLKLTETEYGVLSGVTFALLSGTFSLLSGILVDRFNRKIILIISGLCWSLLTFAQSYAVDFPTILIPRVFMEITITACNV